MPMIHVKNHHCWKEKQEPYLYVKKEGELCCVWQRFGCWQCLFRLIQTFVLLTHNLWFHRK